MELLLNVAWLLLALPAIWIWRRNAGTLHPARSLARIVSFLTLGCVLLLLFPVISATDDLHPVQADVEEANPLRVVKKMGGGHSRPWLPHVASTPALMATALRFGRREVVIGLVFAISFLVPPSVPLSLRDSRAPPSHLG